ncbi:MAG: outer membrane protein assembly factor BamD [Gemmatimonadales bacterium]
MLRVFRSNALAWLAVMALGACARSGPEPVSPSPDAGQTVSQTASPEVIDSLWETAQRDFRHGDWSDAALNFERLLLEFRRGDSRIPKAHFFLGESYFAMNDQLRAVREFRNVSDESPNDVLAPDALLRLGDAFRDLWRRPELDPSYGQSALGVYRELTNRYPASDAAKTAQVRITELENWFATKDYKAAIFYLKFDAYDSAIIYLKGLAAAYPRASITPRALVKLVEAYQELGYQEDESETCGYLRQYHPDYEGTREYCPVPAVPST